MKLYKPIYPANGEGYTPTYKNTYNKEVNGFSVIGQGFGTIPEDPVLREKYINLGLKAHNGLDFPCKEYTPVFAAHDGIVIRLSQSKTSGLGVVVNALDGSFYTIYWHFKGFACQVGQKVRALDLLGYADSTGQSTGHHLHFGLYIQGTPKNNGVDGASDPLPHIVEKPQFSFENNLYIGKSGEEVRNWQIMLANEGFLGYVGFAGFTGYFGSQTFKGTVEFQRKYGILPTGFAGPITRQKADEIYKGL